MKSTNDDMLFVKSLQESIACLEQVAKTAGTQNKADKKALGTLALQLKNAEKVDSLAVTTYENLRDNFIKQCLEQEDAATLLNLLDTLDHTSNASNFPLKQTILEYFIKKNNEEHLRIALKTSHNMVAANKKQLKDWLLFAGLNDAEYAMAIMLENATLDKAALADILSGLTQKKPLPKKAVFTLLKKHLIRAKDEPNHYHQFKTNRDSILLNIGKCGKEIMALFADLCDSFEKELQYEHPKALPQNLATSILEHQKLLDTAKTDALKNHEGEHNLIAKDYYAFYESALQNRIEEKIALLHTGLNIETPNNEKKNKLKSCDQRIKTILLDQHNGKSVARKYIEALECLISTYNQLSHSREQRAIGKAEKALFEMVFNLSNNIILVSRNTLHELHLESKLCESLEGALASYNAKKATMR